MKKIDELNDSELLGILKRVQDEDRSALTGNVMNMIFPWKEGANWIFDDPARGLVREPFVLGIPEMIDEIVELLGLTGEKVKFIFSKNEFPQYHAYIEKTRDEAGSAWYKVGKSNIGELSDNEGWLCPATLLYFEAMPDRIYLRIEKS